MVRRTEEEELNAIKSELEKKQREVKELENAVKKEKEDDDDNEIPDMTKDSENVPTQIVEREINHTLLNDKLNFIIGLLQSKNI